MQRTGDLIIGPGDHIALRRAGGLFTHHALHLGGGDLIHYSDPNRDLRRAAVRIDPFSVVAAGDRAFVIRHPFAYAPDVAVRRALSRFGEQDYHLARNNCEAFVRWAKTGNADSFQDERASSAVFGSLRSHACARLGVGALLSAGAANGASGAATVMSGLRAAGTLVGRSAAGGLGVIATVPATMTTALWRMFRDDEFLTNPERAARRAARGAALAAAAAGIGVAVYTVAGLGVPGMSAVGISSGLATLGSSLGGGMLTGLGLVAIGPAVVAAGLAFLSYALFGGGRNRLPLLPGQFRLA